MPGFVIDTTAAAIHIVDRLLGRPPRIRRLQQRTAAVRNNARRLKFWRVYRAALRMGGSR
jgi:hypothetical protein